MTAENRCWILRKRPDPEITDETLSFERRPIPEPAAGEVLVRNLYLSLDPANRGWMNDERSYVPPVGLGEVMRGITVGRVERSNSDALGTGKLVQGMGGYADYAVGPARAWREIPEGVEPTQALGVLGHIGLTAYFGLFDIGKPNAGDTVLVSGAAGATGSLVCQMAKLTGCRVVGIAGGGEKCSFLQQELGVDAAIDYKSEPSLSKAVAKACPDGVNVFFDNVGGAALDAALANLALHGRVVICGAISQYNRKQVEGPRNYLSLLVHRGRMEGFVVLDYVDRAPEAFATMLPWIQTGKLTLRLDVVHGLDQAAKALGKLFAGENRGKLLIQIAD